MTKTKSHFACDPLLIWARQNYKLALLAAARLIRAMQTKYIIAVILLMIAIAIELTYHIIRPFYWRIIKLICFFEFIEQGLVWIYTFISFGFLLISFLLKRVVTSASTVCYVFQWYVATFFSLLREIIQILIACDLLTLAANLSPVLITWIRGAFHHNPRNETKRLNQNDSRTGQSILEQFRFHIWLLTLVLITQFVSIATEQLHDENVVIENLQWFSRMLVSSSQPILNCYWQRENVVRFFFSFFVPNVHYFARKKGPDFHFRFKSF